MHYVYKYFIILVYYFFSAENKNERMVQIAIFNLGYFFYIRMHYVFLQLEYKTRSLFQDMRARWLYACWIHEWLTRNNEVHMA